MFCIKCGIKLAVPCVCPACGAENDEKSRNNYLRAPEIKELMKDDEDLALIMPEELTEEEIIPENGENGENAENAENSENEDTPAEGSEIDIAINTDNAAKKEDADNCEEKADDSDETPENAEADKPKPPSPKEATIEIFANEIPAPAAPVKKKHRKILVHRLVIVVAAAALIVLLICLIACHDTTETEPELSGSFSTAQPTDADEEPTEPPVTTASPVYDTGKTAEERLEMRDTAASELNADAVRIVLNSEGMAEECLKALPKFTFSEDFDYTADPEAYDRDKAEEFIAGDTDIWDDESSCGTLKGSADKQLYYFFHNDTYGRQYCLADKGKAPDGTDVMYIHPIDGTEYYLACRSANGTKSFYLISGRSLYAIPEKYMEEPTDPPVTDNSIVP